MNFPIFIAVIVVLLGLIAQITAGNKETLGAGPEKVEPAFFRST